MFTKLFAIYPAPGDPELKVRAYIDETRDIPALVISHGLKRLVRKGGEFAPNVASIRKECALFLREQHRQASGLDQGSPIEMDGELAERWLSRSHEPLPRALPAGKPLELQAGLEVRREAAAALQAEIDRLERKMRAAR